MPKSTLHIARLAASIDDELQREICKTRMKEHNPKQIIAERNNCAN
jgi:hypothetical protein